MAFENPAVLLLAVPVALLMFALALTHPRPRPAYCRRGSPLVRSLLALAVLIALAGPSHIATPAAPQADESATGSAAVAWIEPHPAADTTAAQELLGELRRGGVTRGQVQTSDGAMPATLPVNGGPHPAAWPWDPAAAPDNEQPSRLGTTLPTLRRQMPDVRERTVHIVAVAPPPQAVQQALAIAGLAWRFHPLPLREVLPQPVLGRLQTDPARPEPDRPVRVQATLFGAPAGTTWRPVVDGEPRAWRPVPVPNGETTTSAVNLQTDELRLAAGVHGVAFDVRPPDATATLRSTGAIVVTDPPRWAVLANATAAGAAGAAWVRDLATGAGIAAQVTTVVPERLFDHAGVVLPLTRLLRIPPSDVVRLRRFVKEGGGLIVPALAPTSAIDAQDRQRMAGLLPARPGADSSDSGHLQGVNQHELPDDVARVSVVFLIDNSGSMQATVGDRTRGQYVAAALKASLDALQPRDRVSVVYFDARAHTPLGPWPATPARIAELKREIDRFPPPDYNTSLIAACQAAREVLRRESAAVKHVVLLSDGEDTVTPYGDFTGQRRQFEAAGISCSIIGIGEYDPPTLRAIHTPGNGFLHFAQTGAGTDYYANRIPQIFLGEVRRGQQRGDFLLPDPTGPDEPMAMRTGRYDVRVASPGVPYAFADFPPVLRHISLAPLPGARTVLDVRPPDGTGESTDTPFLVTWRVGLGEVAILGATLDAEGMPDWFDWPRAGEFVGTWLRAVGNPRPGEYRLTAVAQTHTRNDADTRASHAISGRLVRVSGGALPDVTLQAVPAGPLATGTSAEPIAVPLEPGGRFRLELLPDLTDRFAAVQFRVAPTGADAPRVAGTVALDAADAREAGGTAWWQRPVAKPVAGNPSAIHDRPVDAPEPRRVPMTGVVTALLLMAAVLVPVDVFLRR